MLKNLDGSRTRLRDSLEVSETKLFALSDPTVLVLEGDEELVLEIDNRRRLRADRDLSCA